MSFLNIRRGEIWLLNLDPTIGAEIRKTRPVIVVNSDSIGILPIRLVAPLTEWKDYLGQECMAYKNQSGQCEWIVKNISC